MGSSLIGTVFMLLLFGGCGAYYYFVVYKKMMSPEARAAAFAAAGYRPGETVQASFGGILVQRGPSGGFMESIMELQRGGTPTHVFSNITTQDRLHLTIGVGTGAQHVLFEANARPPIRVLGRVFLQDTTGIGDVLMSQTETTVFWVAEGNQPPPNTVRRVIYNQVGREEPTCVLEITAPGQAPFHYETYDSGVQAILQWAGRAGLQQQAPQGFAPQQPMHAPPGYGAPPAQSGYGAPQPPQPGYGAPPQPAYGAPQSPGYGAPQPPAGYSAQPQPGYGAAPQQGSVHPPGGYPRS